MIDEKLEEKTEFITIPAGTFTMGSPESEKNRFYDETQKQIPIERPFEIGKTPIAQSQWFEVMGTNPSHFKNRPNNPVESVSWNDCQEFISKLNANNDGYTYRLPSEAEWEYACRAGTTAAYSFGDDIKELSIYAVWSNNSKWETNPVKSRLPNPWGLFDMHGNVWEWTDSVYAGSTRVLRGGSWNNRAGYLRSASRTYDLPGRRLGGVGFRLVRTKTLPSNTITLGSSETAKHAEVMIRIRVIKEQLTKLEEMLR